MENILEKIEQLMQEIIYNDDIKITMETTLDKLYPWDDLDTVELSMALEEEYDIEFYDDEIEEFNSIERIVKIIEKKLKEK